MGCHIQLDLSCFLIIIIIITKQLLRKTFTLTQLIWHFCHSKTLVDGKSWREFSSLCVALQWHGVKNLRGKWWPKIIWRHALFRSIKKRNLHPVDNVFSSKQFSLHYRIFGEYSNPSCPSQWSFASCAVQTLFFFFFFFFFNAAHIPKLTKLRYLQT